MAQTQIYIIRHIQGAWLPPLQTPSFPQCCGFLQPWELLRNTDAQTPHGGNQFTIWEGN